MANFAQKRAARESIEGTGTVVPDGLELPAESVEGILAELAEKERDIDTTDSEHDVLVEDGNETDAQLDAVDAADDAAAEPADDKMEAEEDMPDEAAEALDVAQESIRRRWGFDHRTSVARESYGSRNRRSVARESLWEDIKAFLKRAWEWLKEQGRKIKDRWLKFSNQGKSVQGRSKKFGEQIKKLSKQKSGKDKLSGGFIKDLSIAGKFEGTDTSALDATFSKKGDFAKAQDEVLAEMTGTIDGVVSASEADFAKTGKQAKDLAAVITKEMKVEMHQLGNQVFKVETDVSEDGDSFEVSTTLVDADASVESDVATPSVAQLSAINTFFNKVGVEIEKKVKAYHATNQKRDRYEAAIEKLLKKIDGVKIDEQNGEFSKSIRLVRKMVSATNQFLGAAERADAANTRALVSGLNGLLVAGIAAYEKK
jgi:phage gp36-like protein